MTELKYLRDEARADYIDKRLNVYPNLKDYINNIIEKNAKSGNGECIINFKSSEEADFAETILEDSGYGCYRVAKYFIKVSWY